MSGDSIVQYRKKVKYRPWLGIQAAERFMKLKPMQEKHFEIIRPWRNIQMSILRQDHFLDEKEQKKYAEAYIDHSLDEQPEQVLFAVFVNGVFMAYGGLTHINWEEGSAEVSYLRNPKNRAKYDYPLYYTIEWLTFLRLLETYGRAMKITKWRSETLTSTGDHTRTIHIQLLRTLYLAKEEHTGNSIIQRWEI